MTSKFYEDKAFAKDKNKNHPKGRDMTNFEIRKILIGDLEVFTDLKFLQVSTLPLELHPIENIKIYYKGDVNNAGQKILGMRILRMPMPVVNQYKYQEDR